MVNKCEINKQVRLALYGVCIFGSASNLTSRCTFHGHHIYNCKSDSWVCFIPPLVRLFPGLLTSPTPGDVESYLQKKIAQYYFLVINEFDTALRRWNVSAWDVKKFFLCGRFMAVRKNTIDREILQLPCLIVWRIITSCKQFLSNSGIPLAIWKASWFQR